jgi:hypothetical protein
MQDGAIDGRDPPLDLDAGYTDADRITDGGGLGCEANRALFGRLLVIELYGLHKRRRIPARWHQLTITRGEMPEEISGAVSDLFSMV